MDEELALTTEFKLRLPQIPEMASENMHDVCEFYAHTPNLRQALLASAVAWTTVPEDLLDRALNDIRSRGDDVSRFIKDVDDVYFAQQQSRTMVKHITQRVSEIHSRLPLDGLTDQQKDFVMHYTGNVKEALVAAGIKPTNKNKLSILGDGQVKECKDMIDEVFFAINVPTAAELIYILGNIARDPGIKASERTAAVKLLMQKDGLLQSEERSGAQVVVQIANHIA